MSLRQLESLETLDLSMNAFDGFIPSWIGESLSLLKVLNVHSNKFEEDVDELPKVMKKLGIRGKMTPKCFGSIVVWEWVLWLDLLEFVAFCTSKTHGGFKVARAAADVEQNLNKASAKN
ncbi:hypothetical protein GH714_032156 [Hevea brasiliensis]|uniref:Uncharacterized protein n=1 Tax=Hevea brasiliensis TaxID=3981 RepID=A0A6A6LG19_HEVBR|nr:hypothetical protein GH714_032156 [Hevea brasiliensis]